MHVIVLGTGSPNEARVATGMVVTAPGCEPLVIDTCGGFEFYRQLLGVGIPIGDLRNVILTHRHLDHIGGMAALFIEQQPLDIYALADTHEAVRGLMAVGYPEWEIHPEVRRIEIAPGERREIGGFTVEFFAVVHRVPTVAVRVSQGGKTFAFSADSLPCDALIDCAREADLFLCDALYAASDAPALVDRARMLMHPTAREAAEMATRAGVRSLILTHLSGRSSAESILLEARAHFSGPVVVAEDGGRYAV